MFAVASGTHPSMPTAAQNARLLHRRSRILRERLIEFVLFSAALVSV